MCREWGAHGASIFRHTKHRDRSRPEVNGDTGAAFRKQRKKRGEERGKEGGWRRRGEGRRQTAWWRMGKRKEWSAEIQAMTSHHCGHSSSPLSLSHQATIIISGSSSSPPGYSPMINNLTLKCKWIVISILYLYICHCEDNRLDWQSSVVRLSEKQNQQNLWKV